MPEPTTWPRRNHAQDQQPTAVEHEPIRWDQINERPQAGEEPIPLEPWLEDRLATHEALVRQRSARGDKWFFAALAQWDVRNTHELLTRVAPDQVDGYYRGDGVPGYRLGEEEAYYERQHAWLVDKLRALRGGEATPSSGGDLVARGDELLRKVQMERREIERYGAPSHRRSHGAPVHRCRSSLGSRRRVS